MIHSGLKSAARALPHQQLKTASRVGTVICCSTQPFSSQTSSASAPLQRRLSSSKASCPPGDRSDSPRAAAAKPADAAKPAPPRTSARHGTRAARSRKQKDEAWTAQRGRSRAWFSRLPSVPDVHSLSERDIKLSSLFALHRPLSLHAPIPTPTAPADFARIFEPTAPGDVMSTLSATIAALERPELPWHSIEDTVRHLDGAPQPRSIEEMVAALKPFDVPPPPVPQGQTDKKRRAPAVRAYEITVNVREVPPPAPAAKALRMSFGTRVKIARVLRARQGTQTVRDPRRKIQWRLISVKRQRKLKMKKHKYKKLMKRTRTLRRKLDK